MISYKFYKFLYIAYFESDVKIEKYMIFEDPKLMMTSWFHHKNNNNPKCEDESPNHR